MKSIHQTHTITEAHSIIQSLKSHGIYSCLSGCKSRGYEILVRDSHASLAIQLLKTKGN